MGAGTSQLYCHGGKHCLLRMRSQRKFQTSSAEANQVPPQQHMPKHNYGPTTMSSRISSDCVPIKEPEGEGEVAVFRAKRWDRRGS